MGDEEHPGLRSGGEGPSSGPQIAALAERVARLELEIVTLQRQIAGGVGAQPAARVDPTGPLPPPPPMPAPASHSATVAGPRSPAFTQAPIFAQPAKSQESLEDRLGSQVFNRIAIVLLLIGTAYFLKMAIDRGWIGPTGRVVAGLVAGAGLVVWSERFRRKGFAPFSYSLKALGSGILYLSLWAAFHYFHLLPASAALILMMSVTAWNAYMAWAQDSELLATYALAGGIATPLLLSTGGNHETFLFTYLLAIDVATVALVRLKTWPRLLLGAFPATAVFFVGWYGEFFAAYELSITSLFIVLFGMAFASVPLRRSTSGAGVYPARNATLLEDILLPLANAAFVALAFYSVLQDSGHHDLAPWMMVALAAAYLGIMRVPQTAAASAIHLSLAVVLLTIAIPLKASGHWITVSWLVEGWALLWVAARLMPGGEDVDADEHAAASQASRVLRPLALGSLLLGFGGVCAHSIAWADVAELPLLNKVTGTALTGVLVFAAAAWLALGSARELQAEPSNHSPLRWDSLAMIAFALVDLTAALLTLRELLLSWNGDWIHPPFQTADLITALIGLAVFAGVVAASLRVAAERPGETFWPNCAALSTVAFNLIAVLTGVREIAAIWGSSSAGAAGAGADAALQQALAISAFLMLYGAALLAVGFMRRSGFLRWQALALLVFTIFKAFLYDMRSLSQGYRVVSFLGLGALLMAISFAYQKDLLHLREPETPPVESDSEAAR